MLRKNTTIVRECTVGRGTNQECSVKLVRDDTGKLSFVRRMARNSLVVHNDCYRFTNSDGVSSELPFDDASAAIVFQRLVNGEGNNAFVVSDVVEEAQVVKWVKTPQEHKFTSTGVKFWRHPHQMNSFKQGQGSSIISTHVSPEGSCNLSCPYCSVTYRATKNRIELKRVKDYLLKLWSRGLKAVIFTGGGEPTLYPTFNELVQWAKHDLGLSVGLISNGTTQRRIKPETYKCLSWMRVSVNLFDGWQDKISIDRSSLADDCVVGCSFVYTAEHASGHELDVSTFTDVSNLATKLGAKYIRLLPNCLLEQDKLLREHEALKTMLENLGDDRFFHQYKVHGTPRANVCHQSYFRPYLSEETFVATGVPGTVYPCDSVVLNNGEAHFAERYQLCSPEDVLKYLDREITPRFQPCNDCSGCVFTENVDMLGAWKDGELDRFDEFQQPLMHEEFV